MYNNKNAMADLDSECWDSMGEHMINSDLQDGDQVTKDDTPADGAPTDPNYYEERFRVDRRKLEQMLQVYYADGSTEEAENFFQKIMDETNTHITWPSKLKIGAKSKKDPHIKVSGKKENVWGAKDRIMNVLDTKSTRVTLKMDVSHTEHSHVIGKGGNNIKGVMQDTGCHIHFPDSNRNNQVEKSNQVSIAGQPIGVEQARVKIRELLPLVFMFELPVTALSTASMLDPSSPTISQIQQKYNVTVSVKQRPKHYISTVIVRGSVVNAKAVKEATLLLMEHLTGSVAAALPVNMQLDIAPQHHLFIIGRGGANIKQIMQQTNATIHFPEPTAAMPQRKGTVYITGPIESVYQARLHLIGCLPLVLMFDMKEEREIEQCELTSLMEQLDVFISVKLKPKQPSKSVIVKSIERNAGSLHEARRRLLGLVTAEVPRIISCSNDCNSSTIPTASLSITSLGLLGQNLLNTNPLHLMLSTGQQTTPTSTPALMSPNPNAYLYNPLLVLAASPGPPAFGLHSPVPVMNATTPHRPMANGTVHNHATSSPAHTKHIIPKTTATVSVAPATMDSLASQRNKLEGTSPPHRTLPHRTPPGIPTPAYSVAGSNSHLNLISQSGVLTSALSDTALHTCPSPLADMAMDLQDMRTSQSLMDIVLPSHTSPCGTPALNRSQELFSHNPNPSLVGVGRGGSPHLRQRTLGLAESGLGGLPGSPTRRQRCTVPLHQQSVVGLLEERMRGLPFQNGDNNSPESGSEPGSGSRTPLGESPGNSLFPSGSALFSAFNYEQKKLLANKAMQKKPEGESRIPTDFWAGLGFSKSMPDSEIRERLKLCGNRYHGPSMTTTYENVNGESERELWKDSAPGSPLEAISSSPPGLEGSVPLSPTPPDFSSVRHRERSNWPNSLVNGGGNVNGCLENSMPPGLPLHSDWPPRTDMAELFSKIGLGKYTDLFQQQEIDIGTFLTLTDGDLKELGISTFGARRKMLLAIQDLTKGQQTLMSAAPGDNNPFRKGGANTSLNDRRSDIIASQSGRW